MPYSYQAELWCDTCAERIKLDIARETRKLIPDNPDDETSFASDDYPKYYDTDERSDRPQNCASGTCGGEYTTTNPADHKYLGVGRYGTFLENGLTKEGYRYLKSMLDEHGEHLPSHAVEWADYYGFTYHKNEYGNAHKWLESQIDKYAEMSDGRLVQLAKELARELDEDKIQDLYQSDMDEDGYFRVTGWYSDEMEGN